MINLIEKKGILCEENNIDIEEFEKFIDNEEDDIKDRILSYAKLFGCDVDGDIIYYKGINFLYIVCIT